MYTPDPCPSGYFVSSSKRPRFSAASAASSGSTGMYFSPRLSGMIIPPGRSIAPISAFRAAMARPPWTPFECWPGPLQTSTRAGFVVASSRAIRSIVFALTEVICSAHAGVLSRT